MQKIKEFLLTSLGTGGMLLFFAISIFITVFPLIMFEMPWFLYIVLALLVQFVIVNIPFGLEVLWIIGLIGAISGEQDVFAIIYYILFVLIVGSTVVRLFKILLTKE